MPTVDFGACLSNYWFVWTIDGLGSVFALAINMAISFFFLKYFHNMAGTPSQTTSTPTESATDFQSIDASSTAMPTASV